MGDTPMNRHEEWPWVDRVTELFEAVRRRASFLADASGTSPHIEEALVILAAGEVTPSRIREGSRRSAPCRRRCTGGGFTRLTQLGFPAPVAEEMSEMHTPNFM